MTPSEHPKPAECSESQSIHAHHNTDLFTRTSWTDARVALSQINKGKATGNRASLWLRTKLQANFFALGCFIQRHADKVLILGILALTLSCIGLKSATLETNVEELWVEEGGRLEGELKYIRETLGDGAGSTHQIVIQTPKEVGANILHPESLLLHLDIIKAATQVSVEIFDVTWKLKDICLVPSYPTFDSAYVIEQIFEHIFPCVIITPLDCFWEGSQLLGPDHHVTIPGLGGKLRWTNLNPQKLLENMRSQKFNFPYDAFEDFMKRAGITSAYQEKPCLDPQNKNCPVTSPNKMSGQPPDVGSELTGGCYGFATKFMHWPEDLVVGGTVKNKTGHITRAEAYQTIVQLMGQKEMFEFHAKSYKVHNMDWTMEKAAHIVNKWQEKFISEIVNQSKTSPNAKFYQVHSFSTSTFSQILGQFSEISHFRIGLGYIVMVLYAGISLLRCSDPVNSQSGLGISGVLLVALSVISGLGFCQFLSRMGFVLTFNASTTQVIPFLTLGLGVDDMFLLIHTYAESSKSDGIPYQFQIGEVLKRAGLSVLVTSLCIACAFFAAAIIPIPALRAFALQVSILVIYNLLSMMIIFPALMCLDLRRRKAKRADILCCLPSHVEQCREMEGSGKKTFLLNMFPGKLGRIIPQHSEVPKKQTVTRALPPDGQNTITIVVDPADCWNNHVTPPASSIDSLSMRTSTGELISDGPFPPGNCSQTKQQCWKYSLTWFAREYFGPWLTLRPVKVSIILIFFGILSASVWGLMRLKDGLNLTDIVPRGTAQYNFLIAQDKYFGFYNMYAVTKGNFEYPTNQRLLYEYHDAFMRVSKIIKNDDGGLPQFWLSLFRDWLIGLQKKFDKDWSKGCINQEGWFSNSSDEGILAYKLLVQTGHVDNPIDKTLVTQVRLVDNIGIINPKAFYNYLSAWASNDPLAYSFAQADLFPEPKQWYHVAQDVELKIPKSLPLIYTQLPFYLNDLGETADITEMIEQVRSICGKFEEKGLPNFPSGIPFKFWEQYLNLRHNLLLALMCALAITFLVISVLLMNLWAAGIVVIVLALLVIQLTGVMGLLGIKLSAIPAVILIVSVGIGVEFTVHIVVGFLTSIGSRDRRSEMAVEHMFAPVVHGAISTLLGIALLGFSEFDFIVRYFFYVLLAFVLLGILNGLVLLPVLLSLFGPSAEVIPRDYPDRISTPSPEPSPVPTSRDRPHRSLDTNWTGSNRYTHNTHNSGHYSRRGGHIPPRRMNSDISLTTITEEPNSWHSNSHEIVVHPEVVVQTSCPSSGRHGSPSSSCSQPGDSNSQANSSSSSDSSSCGSSTPPPVPHKHKVRTKVTATAKVKVEVHTPLPSSISKDYRRSRRKGRKCSDSESSDGAR